MPPWVAFFSLILLWADVVVSLTQVTGVVGQSVTLPCLYSTSRDIAPMCWGRGSCPSFKCSNELMWTDGHRVTFEKDKRYRMNGIISSGNLSLTIENAALSDTGTYCCRVEFRGWFNDYKKNIYLEIKPAPTTVPTPPKVFTSAPTAPATTKTLKTATPNVTMIPTSSMGMVSSATATPVPPQKSKTAPPKVTTTMGPTPPKVTMGTTPPMVSMSASTKSAGEQQKFKTETTSSSPVQTTETPPITPQPTSTTSSSLNSAFPTDGTSIMSQPSDGGWQYNKTHMDLEQNSGLSTNKPLSLGLFIIAAVLLLTILAAIVPAKYLCQKRKALERSKEPQDATLQNETAVSYQVHESIHLKKNPYTETGLAQWIQP